MQCHGHITFLADINWHSLNQWTRLPLVALPSTVAFGAKRTSTGGKIPLTRSQLTPERTPAGAATCF